MTDEPRPPITELWYTLLHLDLRSPHVRDAIADTQALHKLVQHGFDEQRAAYNILYRQIPARPGYPHQVLISSTTRPAWGPINGTILTADVKNITKQWRSIRKGTGYRFRITANPTFTDDSKRRRAVTDPANQALWLARKMGEGASINHLTISPPVTRSGMREGKPVIHQAVTYNGLLTVGDPEVFRDLIATGIGRGKAYGHGLLTIAPA